MGENKSSKFVFTILFLVSAHLGHRQNSFAQSQFQLAIGGRTTGEEAYSIIQTADGGYVAAGDTSPDIPTDMYIVKLNPSGQLQWSRTVGGPQSFRSDIAFSVVQTTDGGYTVAGMGEGGTYIYIVKINSGGTVEWVRRIAGAWIIEYAFGMIQTKDGGYAVCTIGYLSGNSDMYIVKLDGAGMLQWSRNIGGPGSDYANCIIQTTDGGYAVAGETTSFGTGSWDMFIVKIDSGGTVQWSKTIGGPNADFAYSIVQTTDGYAIVGYTSSFGAGSHDMYIVKFASDGSLQWTKTVGGTGSDRAYSVAATSDGGCVVAGSTNSFGAGFIDMYVVRLDSAGTLQWSRTVGGTGEDWAYSIKQTSDGGYIAAGYTSSFGAGGDMFIVKFDANGNTCGNSTSPSSSVGTGGILGSPSPTVTYPIPTVITVSPTIGSLGTVTTICVIGIQPISNEIPDSYRLYQNYPNPFNAETVINFQLSMFNSSKLEIFDVLGRKVSTLVNQELKPGVYEVEWDGTNYASGVYYYQLSIINPVYSGSSIEYKQTKRMVMLK